MASNKHPVTLGKVLVATVLIAEDNADVSSILERVSPAPGSRS
jgi:hypothetical protein